MSGADLTQAVKGAVKQSGVSGLQRVSGIWSGGYLFITAEREVMITEGEGQIYGLGPSSKTGFVLSWPNTLVDLEDELEETPNGVFHFAITQSRVSPVVEVRISEPWPYLERRDKIYLGYVTVVDGEPVFARNLQFPIKSLHAQVESALNSMGSLIVDGLRFEPQSKLRFGFTSGVGFQRASGYTVPGGDPNHRAWEDQLSAPFVTYVHRDGEGGWTGTAFTENEIRPGLWDDGSGVLKPVPPNRYTLQTVYLNPGSGLVVIQYGQELLASRDKVANALIFAEWEPYQEVSFVRRAILAVKGGTVTLQNRKSCIISRCDRFGRLGGE